MQALEFKENGWKYSNEEKFAIAALGIGGIISNVASNFNIGRDTFYRWRGKLKESSETSFGRKPAVKITAEAEKKEARIEAFNFILSKIPVDVLGDFKSSDEYRAFCVDLVKNRKSLNVDEACEVLGITSKTYYNWKKSVKVDRRNEFINLAAVDFLLENKHMDKYSLSLKLLRAGIPVTLKEAGSIRREAISYIKEHNLREVKVSYQFLQPDDAWAMDFMQVYDENDSVAYILKIIDENSRNDLATLFVKRATTAVAIAGVKLAMQQTGRKPIAIKSDRGTQFKVIFGNFLKEEKILHLKSYPYYPEFSAKVERRIQDVGVFILKNPNMNIRDALILESNLHNFVRPHEGLNGLVPSQVYWMGVQTSISHKAKFEPVKNWFPHIDTDLCIAIIR